jgi:adenine deaminase
MKQAESEWGQSSLLIMSFLRHLSEESAMHTLDEARPYLAMISAVGLDSSELGHPPEKFERVFAKAKTYGLKRVAHAGEEGPPAYVWGAAKSLEVNRIDHGVRSLEDPELVAHLVSHKIPLTVCPLSNTKLKVFQHMKEHNILQLLEHGLVATINADDPSYFGGYLNDNYFALIEHLPIDKTHLIKLVKNSFTASFLPEKTKQYWLTKVM